MPVKIISWWVLRYGSEQSVEEPMKQAVGPANGGMEPEPRPLAWASMSHAVGVCWYERRVGGNAAVHVPDGAIVAGRPFLACGAAHQVGCRPQG